MAAYVWRSRVRALRLHNGKTMLTMLVGMRRNMMENPLPEGYYENSVVDANVVLDVSELNGKPLFETVQKIRETKNVAFTHDLVQNCINSAFLQTNHEEEFNMECSGAVTVLMEWKHLGFQGRIDYGGLEAMNFVTAPCNMFKLVGTCILMSPSKLDDQDPSMRGGVRVFITLPEDAMPKFKEEMEALTVS